MAFFTPSTHHPFPTTILVSEEQQEFFFLARLLDKVLKSSEQFWIVTVRTAPARQKNGLIPAHCYLATFRSAMRAAGAHESAAVSTVYKS